MKHLLKLLDLSTEEIPDILNLAAQLKPQQKSILIVSPVRPSV